MKKDLSYYLNLDYKIEITPISKEMGGGYEASIPELGKYAFIGYGKTPSEAIRDLNKTKKQYFKEFIQKEIDIPEPEERKEFRGEFLLRMPKFLHQELYEAAKANETSLNQYMNILLTRNLQIYQIGQLITECFQHFWKNVWMKSKYIPEIEKEIPHAFILEERKSIGA